jgi:hypothetical protein
MKLSYLLASRKQILFSKKLFFRLSATPNGVQFPRTPDVALREAPHFVEVVSKNRPRFVSVLEVERIEHLVIGGAF